MTRSWDLTKGSRWRVLTVIIIVGVIGFIVSLIFQIPGLILNTALRLGDPLNTSVLSQIVTQIGNFFALCLVTPLGTIATSLLYYDQRVRKEGFDLHLMISSLESGESKSNEAPHMGI
jgi:hypothetical protein